MLQTNNHSYLYRQYCIKFTKKYRYADIFRLNNKAKTLRDLAFLRVVRLIACNVVDKALKIMKEYNFDINCNFETEFPDFYFYITKSRTFIGIALLHSSFSTIKKLIKAGAKVKDLKFDHCPLKWSETYMIPQIIKICDIKNNKSLLYSMGVNYVNACIGCHDFDEPRGEPLKRFSLINNLLLTEPLSCNIYKITKRNKIQMLHKNISSSNTVFEPDKKLFCEYLSKNKVYFDLFFLNYFGWHNKYLRDVEKITKIKINGYYSNNKI